MVRTRLRENQAKDIDFLTEQEGYQSFFIRENYGINKSNFIIEDGYYLHLDKIIVDGYFDLDSISDPETNPDGQSLFLYNKNGYLYKKNSSGVVSSVISSFKTFDFTGQDLIAIGEDTLQWIAGSGISYTTDNTTGAKKLTITNTGTLQQTYDNSSSATIATSENKLITISGNEKFRITTTNGLEVTQKAYFTGDFDINSSDVDIVSSSSINLSTPTTTDHEIRFTTNRIIQTAQDFFLTASNSSGPSSISISAGSSNQVGNIFINANTAVIIEEGGGFEVQCDWTKLRSSQLYIQNGSHSTALDGYVLTTGGNLDGYSSWERLEASSVFFDQSEIQDGYILDGIDNIQDGLTTLSDGYHYLDNKIDSLVSANGSFVPIIKMGETTQSTTYCIGEYSKTQNIVTVSINTSFTVSGTGDLTIQGLPYLAQNTTNLQQGFTVIQNSGITIPLVYGSGSQLIAIVSPNTSVVNLQLSAESGNSNIDQSDLASTVTLSIIGTYLTDAEGSGVSFTPIPKIGQTSQSTSWATGYYSKIGKTIFYSIITSFNKSGTGDLTIQGLPFLSKNISNLIQGGIITKQQGIAVQSFYGENVSLKATIQPNSDVINIEKNSSNGNSSITNLDLNSTVIINITGTYISD